MADNLTTVNAGTGQLPNNTVIATRDSGAGHWQQVDVGPAFCAPLTSGQYNLSVGTGAVVTLTVPTGATHAVISIEPSGATGVRWTRDGTAPTASIGHLLAAGDAMEVDNVATFKMIGLGGTAIAQVSYHKYV